MCLWFRYVTQKDLKGDGYYYLGKRYRMVYEPILPDDKVTRMNKSVFSTDQSQAMTALMGRGDSTNHIRCLVKGDCCWLVRMYRKGERYDPYANLPLPYPASLFPRRYSK